MLSAALGQAGAQVLHLLEEEIQNSLCVVR